MNRVDFGKLIASLRKEHDDEEDIPWTQERLAQEANSVLGAEAFTGYVISSIERGRRKLDHQTLATLATALQLTSGECREFLLAASGVDLEAIARPDNVPEDVLSWLINRLNQAYLPGHILDSYCDVVAVNNALINLVSLESSGVGPQGVAHSFPFNKVLFAFAEVGEEHLGDLMGEDWSDHAYETMMMFRTVSLRYRPTEYFKALLKELKRSRRFKRCWQEVYFDEKDHFVESRQMSLDSPKWGAVAYFPTYLTAVTSAGDLHLCMYVPASRNTAEVFSRIFEQPGAGDVLRLGSWPEKRLP